MKSSRVYRYLMALPFVLGVFLVACAPESDKPRHQTLQFRQVPVPSISAQGRVTSPGFLPSMPSGTRGPALPIELESRSLDHIQRPQGLPEPPAPVGALSGAQTNRPGAPHLRTRIGSVSLNPSPVHDHFDVTIQVSSQVLNFRFQRRALGTLVEVHYEGFVLNVDCRNLECTQAFLQLREAGTGQVAEIRYQSNVEYLQANTPLSPSATVQVPTPQSGQPRAADPRSLVQEYGTLPATRETVVIAPAAPSEPARQIEVITVEPPQVDQGPGIGETPAPQNGEASVDLPVEEDTPEELVIPPPPPVPPAPPPIRFQAEQELQRQGSAPSQRVQAPPSSQPSGSGSPQGRVPQPAPSPRPSQTPAPSATSSPAPAPAVTPTPAPTVAPAPAQPAASSVATPPAVTSPQNLRNGVCSIAGHLIPAVNGNCQSGILRTGCSSGRVACNPLYGAVGAPQACVPDTADSTMACWNKVRELNQVNAAVEHIRQNRRAYAQVRRGLVEFCRGLVDQELEGCLNQASPLIGELRRQDQARASAPVAQPPRPAPAPAPTPAPAQPTPSAQAPTPTAPAPAPTLPLPPAPVPPPEPQQTPAAQRQPPPTPATEVTAPTSSPLAPVRLVSDPFVAFGLAGRIPDQLLNSRRPERDGVNLETPFQIVPPREQQPAEPSHRLFVLANALIDQRIPIFRNACNIFLRTALSLTGYTHGGNYLANQYRMLFQTNNQGLRDWDEFPSPGNRYTAVRRVLLDRLNNLPNGYSLVLQVVRNSPHGHVALIAKENDQLYLLDSSYNSRPPTRRAVRAQDLLMERNVRYFIYVEPTVYRTMTTPTSQVGS